MDLRRNDPFNNRSKVVDTEWTKGLVEAQTTKDRKTLLESESAILTEKLELQKKENEIRLQRMKEEEEERKKLEQMQQEKIRAEEERRKKLEAERQRREADERAKRNRLLEISKLKKVPHEIRLKMRAGVCDSEVRRVLKQTNSDYEVSEDHEIPRHMGIYLSTHAPSELEALRVGTQDEQRLKEGVLTTDVLASKMETAYVSINAPDVTEDAYIIQTLETDDEEQLENRFNFVIESTTKPQGTIFVTQSFRHPDIRLEMEDHEKHYAVYYACANLTEYPCDTIVNTTTERLDFHGDLSGDIGKKGGRELTNDCRNYVKNMGPLQVGEVHFSPPGDLDVKGVVNISSPTWGVNQEKNEALLYKATTNALKEADNRLFYSIGLPALCSGGFGYPIEVSLKTIFSAINHYFERRKRTEERGILSEVHLIDKRGKVIEKIDSAMKACYDETRVNNMIDKVARERKTLCYHVSGGNSKDLNSVIEQLKQQYQGLRVSVTKVPSTWAPMHASEQCKFQPLNRSSSDYKELKEIFERKMTRVSLKKIERFQNRMLYGRMMKHKGHMKKDIGHWKSGYETCLWHGTSRQAVENIATNGFTLRHVGKHGHVFGKGLYFAKSPSMSHSYAKPDGDNLRYIFRCGVLVGRSTDETDHMATSAPDGFQSVTGHNGSTYVVFRDSQAYPEYLFTYESLS